MKRFLCFLASLMVFGADAQTRIIWTKVYETRIAEVFIDAAHIKQFTYGSNSMMLKGVLVKTTYDKYDGSEKRIEMWTVKKKDCTYGKGEIGVWDYSMNEFQGAVEFNLNGGESGTVNKIAEILCHGEARFIVE